MEPAAANTPAPIHEIVDALPIFPYPVWMLALAAALLLGLLGFLIWFFFCRPKPKRIPTPQERAIATLDVLKNQEWTPYEFGIGISDVLREYIDEVYGIQATKVTSLEFLESIRNNPRFSGEETSALAAFLDSVDLIKFARVDAGGEELGHLFACAENVIRREIPKEGTVQ